MVWLVPSLVDIPVAQHHAVPQQLLSRLNQIQTKFETLARLQTQNPRHVIFFCSSGSNRKAATGLLSEKRRTFKGWVWCVAGVNPSTQRHQPLKTAATGNWHAYNSASNSANHCSPSGQTQAWEAQATVLVSTAACYSVHRHRQMCACCSGLYPGLMTGPAESLPASSKTPTAAVVSRLHPRTTASLRTNAVYRRCGVQQHGQL